MPARCELSMTQSPDAAEETKPNGRLRYLITDNRHLSTTCNVNFSFGDSPILSIKKGPKHIENRGILKQKPLR